MSEHILLTPDKVALLWDAWHGCADPDAQVALDAAKERSESWAVCGWPTVMVNTFIDPPNLFFVGWSNGLRTHDYPFTLQSAEVAARFAIPPKPYATWGEVIANAHKDEVQSWNPRFFLESIFGPVG